MKVFICEDDEDILQLMQIVLADPQLTIVSCTSAAKAFVTIKKALPDLLIMDYWLDNTQIDPVIDAIRADKELSSIPIVLISAVDNIESVAARLEVDSIIKKPFDIYQLKSQVYELLPKPSLQQTV